MRKVICKIILTIIIISKNEFYQYYTDCVVTGCRSERSEFPFSPAYNLFLPFSDGSGGWMAAVAYGPQNAVLCVAAEASKQTFPVNSLER